MKPVKRRLLRLPDMLQKPGFCKSRPAFDRPFRHAQGFGHFPICHSSKELHPHQLRRFRVLRPQAIQRLVQQQKPFIRRIVSQFDFSKAHPDEFSATALDPRLSPHVFNEDAPHGFGRRGKKQRPFGPGAMALLDQAEPSLMDQRCGLEGLAFRLMGEPGRRQPPQPVID